MLHCLPSTYKTLGSLAKEKKGRRQREEEKTEMEEEEKNRKGKENGEWKKAAKARRPCTDRNVNLTLYLG